MTLLDLAKAFQKYARHNPSCPSANMCGPCNCGFKDWILMVRAFLEEKTT